ERLKELQLEIHQTFIDMVKERRGHRLKDDPDLFTGLFWTGTKGLELGLVDALGDMRSTMKARYGAKTRLKLVSAPRGRFGEAGRGAQPARKPGAAARGLFGRARLLGSRGGSAPAAIAAAAAGGLADAVERRALWSRFGL